MLPKSLFLSLGLLAFQAAQSVVALNATTIGDCPALSARTSAPKGVTDLRADDISLIGAMGDSIMAGALMMGVNGNGGTGILNISAITEYRGNSYAIGGDDSAITLAKFVQRYNSSLKGSSTGSHIGSLCLVPLGCIIIIGMKTIAGSRFESAWKMITIQIGSNDQCASCDSSSAEDVTAEAYGKYVSDAVERIRQNIPRVIVNLLGVFRVSPVYDISAGQEYCRPKNNDSSTIMNRSECSCFGANATEQDRRNMDALADSYNEKLLEIYNKYKANQSDTFAVVYQPANIDIAKFPIEALSLQTHQWIAKAVWNQIYLPQSSKPKVLEFDKDAQIYCPTESDRIQIN
ncbi:hypothetical protein BCR43DRAFT_546773 [Syncephalastrum racemosum]|uniref:SGNH hydrolase-type esterase domain-containing protein n=1 Tax=Syncephalastrum racemosum TaxID=13706 RepID=A0A1X2HHW7_SYNRA|nr:hypothetical protein BCR43DRAFT_546773 [Syncephalastrum racemosum]